MSKEVTIKDNVKLRPILNVAISGHTRIRERLSALQDETVLRAELLNIFQDFGDILRELKENFADLYDNKRPKLRLLSCLAQGTDEIAAEEALKLQQQWGDIDVDVHGICPGGNGTYTVDVATRLPDTHKLTLNADIKDDTNRDYCYRDANNVMLEQADFLIAVWDGKQDNHIGGTFSLIRQAILAGIPVILLKDTGTLHRYYLNYNAKIPYAAPLLKASIEQLLLADEQTKVFQQLYRQDVKRGSFEQPWRIVDGFLKEVANLLISMKWIKWLVSFLCRQGNRIITYDIWDGKNNDDSPQDAAYKVFKSLLDIKWIKWIVSLLCKQVNKIKDDNNNSNISPLEATYQQFDSLSGVFAARHRNSMFERVFFSFVAVTFLACGLSLKSADAPPLLQYWHTLSGLDLYLFATGVIILLCSGLYGLKKCLFSFRVRTRIDRLWWWMCLGLIVCSALYCILGGKFPENTMGWKDMSEHLQNAGGGKIYMWLIFLQNIYLFAVVSITIRSRDANELLRFSYYRMVAERARLGKYTWGLGACGAQSRDRSYLKKSHLWPGWQFRNVLRNVGLPSGNLTQAELNTILEKTENQLAEEQRDYHANIRYRNYTRLGAIFFALTVASFIGWMVASYLRLFFPNTVMFSFLAMLLPGIVSLSGAIISSMELFNFAHVSQQMYEKLTDIKMRVEELRNADANPDKNSLRFINSLNFSSAWRISQDVNCLYTEELADWHRTIAAKNIKVIN